MTQMQPPAPSPVTTRFCSSAEDVFFHRAFLMTCQGSSSLIPRKTLGTKIIITSSTRLLLLVVSSLPAFLVLKRNSASFPNVRAILNKTSILSHLAYSWEPDAWFPPSGCVISPRVRSRSRGKPHCQHGLAGGHCPELPLCCTCLPAARVLQLGCGHGSPTARTGGASRGMGTEHSCWHGLHVSMGTQGVSPPRAFPCSPSSPTRLSAAEIPSAHPCPCPHTPWHSPTAVPGQQDGSWWRCPC